VIKQMGEDANSLVVTPDGRGSSTWYVGKGQVDFREVWADVHKLVRIDRNREYIAGHSMGGWASWLLPILYPDRFAAAFPASGPPTQGLWAGCEDDACFQSANDGRPRDEWTTPLLENLQHVPYVNYQGAADELVPVTGVTAQMEKMRELGLRYRYYVFPHEEHYGPPIFDQWAEGVKYEHEFTRNPNPPSVTLIRSMPMERAVEQVNSGGVPLQFDFDSAFWVSDLTPADATKGTARIDARSLAIPEPAARCTARGRSPDLARADRSLSRGGPGVGRSRRHRAPGTQWVRRDAEGATSVRLDPAPDEDLHPQADHRRCDDGPRRDHLSRQARDPGPEGHHTLTV
jgi:pimeloyl-ACP methyl ester carboxylesterase